MVGDQLGGVGCLEGRKDIRQREENMQRPRGMNVCGRLGICQQSLGAGVCSAREGGQERLENEDFLVAVGRVPHTTAVVYMVFFN